jgi:branched-chain amino acid transport system substrate-binding protein
MRKITAVLTTILALTFCVVYPASAEKEVRIGVIYPLTGPHQGMGQIMLEGIKLAADIINTKNDLNMPLAKTEGLPRLKGAKIRIIPADHRFDIRTGMSEAERLIEQEKVAAIIGCYNSSITEPVSTVAERHGIPFITDSSTAPILTDRGFKWFFSTTPDEEILSNNFFQFLDDLKAKKKMDIPSVAIFTEGSLFGTEATKYQLKYARQHGYNVVGTVVYSARRDDLADQARKLRALGPAVVIQNSYEAEAILSVKTYREINFAPDALLGNANGFITPGFVQKLKKDTNYIISREVWSADLAEKNPLLKAVADMFYERTGKPMNGNSARSFTAMIVLADAINRAGSTKPLKIQKALLKTDLKPGQIIMPWGGVTFDAEKHENVRAKGIIVQIQDGKYYTVWPSDLATREVVWPFPKWEDR